jgi:hypothetical protein
MFRLCIALVGFALVAHDAHAHDDGRYALSPLKSWFEHLSSSKGLCCSYADGFVIDDPDWTVVSDATKSHVHYRVRINGPWIDVPDDALISEPNPVGKAMVWTVMSDFGMSIQCFMPGNMG